MKALEEKELLLRVASLEMNVGGQMGLTNMLIRIVLEIGSDRIPPALANKLKEHLDFEGRCRRR